MRDQNIICQADHESQESNLKLLESLSQFDKSQRIKKPERNEPTLEISEFHLLKSDISNKDAVQIRDLASSLGKKGHHADLTQKVQNARQKAKLLRKPLEKPAAEKIKRNVAFGSAKKELSKWNAIITKNRTAESVRFPLKQLTTGLDASSEFVKRFRIQSGLQAELNALQPVQEEKKEAKSKDYTLTLKEAIMKKQEIAKTRAQQSYREAKAQRRRKIKSKKFHRIEKKSQIKTKMNELSQLQKTNPEAALEVLAQMDKVRAEERMLLRHKSTGQWARSKQMRAKYDKDARQELAQQLTISKELTRKVRNDSDIDEEEAGDMPIQASHGDKENPWVNREKTEQEIDEFVKSYRAYWDEKGKETKDKPGTANARHSCVPRPAENERNNSINSVANSAEGATDAKALSTKKPVVEKAHKELDSVFNSVPSQEEVRSRSQSISSISTGNNCNFTGTSDWAVEPVKGEKKTTTVKAKKVQIPRNSDVTTKENERSKRSQPAKKKGKTLASEEHSTKKRQRRESYGDDFYKGLRNNDEKKRPVLDDPLNETAGAKQNDTRSQIQALISANTASNKSEATSQVKNKESEIDPNKYINVKPKRIHTELPDASGLPEDAMDDNDSGDEEYNIVSEAFAGDDVVEDFEREKEDEIKKGQPKDLDLTLPGWGSWGGKSIKVSKRKRKRFIVKFPEQTARRDENKGDVIIFEGANTRIREHQVRDLPYPFTTVKDFEASMRMPIGRNFVPENAHRKLIERKVKTVMGQIIEPMDEDVLVRMEAKKGLKPLKKKKKVLRQVKKGAQKIGKSTISKC